MFMKYKRFRFDGKLYWFGLFVYDFIARKVDTGETNKLFVEREIIEE